MPKFTLLASRGKELPIHGDGESVRSYLFVEDVAEAFDLVLHKVGGGRAGWAQGPGSEVWTWLWRMWQTPLKSYCTRGVLVGMLVGQGLGSGVGRVQGGEGPGRGGSGVGMCQDGVGRVRGGEGPGRVGRVQGGEGPGRGGEGPGWGGARTGWGGARGWGGAKAQGPGWGGARVQGPGWAVGRSRVRALGMFGRSMHVGGGGMWVVGSSCKPDEGEGQIPTLLQPNEDYDT